MLAAYLSFPWSDSLAVVQCPLTAIASVLTTIHPESLHRLEPAGGTIMARTPVSSLSAKFEPCEIQWPLGVGGMAGCSA